MPHCDDADLDDRRARKNFARFRLSCRFVNIVSGFVTPHLVMSLHVSDAKKVLQDPAAGLHAQLDGLLSIWSSSASLNAHTVIRDEVMNHVVTPFIDSVESSTRMSAAAATAFMSGYIKIAEEAPRPMLRKALAAACAGTFPAGTHHWRCLGESRGRSEASRICPTDRFTFLRRNRSPSHRCSCGPAARVPRHGDGRSVQPECHSAELSGMAREDHER